MRYLAVTRSKTKFEAVDLVKLERLLRLRRPLPKDSLLDVDPTTEDRRCHLRKDRRNERSFLWALTGSSAFTEHQALALRLANCRPDRRCDIFCCHICKHQHWKGLAELARCEADGLRADEMSWCTVIEGVATNTEEAEKVVLDAEERWREWCRKKAPWLSWIGRHEVDYLLPSTTPGTFKARSLAALGWRPDFREPTFVVHKHAILFHPGFSKIQVQYHLRRLFKGPRRVDLRPLRNGNSISTNLSNLVGYPLKFDPPEDALPGRGSRRLKPRGNLELLFYLHLIEELGGLTGPLQSISTRRS